MSTPTESTPDTLGARTRDDRWYDEVRLVGTSGPVIRLVTVPRYKTSGMSGDEWRTSVVWQTTLPFPKREATKDPVWFNFDGGYGRIETGCAALYPGIHRSHEDHWNTKILRVEFLRKGRVFYTAHHDGRAVSLLIAAGHLPWAMVLASDQGMDRDESWERSLCFQPGCAAPAVSTYRLIKKFTNEGDEKPAERDSWKGPPGSKVYAWRRFCAAHGRRGDCGLEDNDRNYIVIDGPGPDGAAASVGAQAAESPSVFGGFVSAGKPA